MSQTAAIQLTSTVQTLASIITKCQNNGTCHLVNLHMDMIGSQTLEALFRMVRCAPGGSSVDIFEHSRRSQNSVLFREILDQHPKLREVLMKDHDIETLNALTLKECDLTLKSCENLDLEKLSQRI